MTRAPAAILLVAICVSACVNPIATEEVGGVVSETMTATEPGPSEMPDNEEPQVILGLGYRPEAFFENQLDLYLPADSDQQLHPAVLLLHGGGEDKHTMEALATQMVAEGFAVVAANFRSMGGGGYPGTVEDAFCALAWMVNAAGEHSLDANRYYAVGFSLGGTLAAMLGVVDEPELYLTDCPNGLPVDFQLRGVVVFTGIFEYASAANSSQAMQEYVEAYLGVAIDEGPEVWVQASAINWVEGNEPPFLLLHGEADENISPLQTHLFAIQLEDAGVQVQKIIVPGVDHFGLIADEASLQAMFQFIQE